MDRAAARRLLDWFAAVRRTLPWRGPFPRDPYAVLVSEVMLQQTQVERVAPGFKRFMTRFPSLASLAAASEDEAVAAFAGMGYYGRARRLQRAARAIVERGAWPATVAELAALPGMGPYTSAAVAAFAFAGAEPPVDGNVARVAARVGALELPLGSAALQRCAAAFARELHAGAPVPELFEALMELGATVCTPRAPRCPACPLRPSCGSARDPERVPLPRPQRAAVAQNWAALWLAAPDGTVLLRRVADGALLAGLWLPPLGTVPAGEAPAAVARELASALGFHGDLAPVAAVAHSITFRRIAVHPFVGSVAGPGVGEPTPDLARRDPGDPGLPTSSLLEKLHRACTGPRQPGLAERWGDITAG
jgi:A/G-specific adenine glycosylase